MSSSTASELAALPGLESAKRVVNGLAAGSAVQSVLFYGVEGSGADSLALILSKAWLCKNPNADGACGVCQSCGSFERGRNADLLRLEPMGASRIIRLAAISASETDDDDYPISAQTFLRTPPLSSRNKVVIIQEAERLNPRAANSLLKILEEPPPYGRFILLTESVGAILPTILSRCLAVACEVPPELKDYEEWIVQLSGGAPGRAAELKQHEAAYGPLYEFAQGLTDRRPEEALMLAERFASLSERMQSSLKLGARAANAESLRVLAQAYSLAPHARAGALQSMIEAHRRILGNANAGSTLDALFASIAVSR